MSFEAHVHPSQTQPAKVHVEGTQAAQASPAPDRFDRIAPSGVSESHPILREKIRLAVLLFLTSEFIFSSFSSWLTSTRSHPRSAGPQLTPA